MLTDTCLHADGVLKLPPDGKRQNVELQLEKAIIGGWMKTGQKADKDAFAFLELHDGSCNSNLQIIMEADKGDLGKADKDAFAFLELHDGSCGSNLQIIVEADKGDLG
ncbi:hypothetical protein ACE6H2_015279 [Prunus campanulata]